MPGYDEDGTVCDLTPFRLLVMTTVRRGMCCGLEQKCLQHHCLRGDDVGIPAMGIGYQVALTILVPTVVLLAGFLGLFFMLRL
jgi:hypothetical protein